MRHCLPLLLGLGLFVSVPSSASLPVAVDGQALPSLAPMLEHASPAVVNIATRGTIETNAHPLMRDPFYRYFFGNRPLKRKTNSLGSGVIVDAAKGYVLTNNHVIENADVITISLQDGRQFDAKLIGTDPDTDVAVLQIPNDRLTALPLTDSDKLRVGDFVVAIGNPFSLGHSVTSGIVSALGRSGLGIEQYENFIQTDAAINPGNSGGALVNLRGELVGINTAILAPGGGNVGIGFAIPINQARGVMQQLIQYGEVRRGLLAIDGDTLTPELAQALDTPPRAGMIITDVLEGSSADRAGLKPYDIITTLNGKPVRSKSELFNQLGLLPLGSSVTLDVVRGDQTRQISVALDSERTYQLDGASMHPILKGALLGNPRAKEEAGAWVRDVAEDSPAGRSGLQAGDVIVAVNRYRVRDLDELKAVVAESGRVLALNIRRGNTNLLLTLR